MTFIMGFFVGLWKNLMWVAFSIVEAFVFMLAYNHLAPEMTNCGYTFLPTDHISWWTSLSIFLIIGFVSTWFKKFIPTLVSINNKDSE